MAVLALTDSVPDKRALLLAPRRTLAAQHGRYSAWTYPMMRSVLVDDERVARPLQLAAACSKASLLIGLPGQVASAIQSAAIPFEIATSIALVLVDEFDEFLTEEYGLEGPAVRFEQDFARLREALPEVPMALMSGSSPGALKTTDAAILRLAEFVERTWHPIVLAPNERSYSKFVPTARVTFVTVQDPEVVELAQAIDTDMVLALQRLEEMVGPFSADVVMPLLTGVLTGRIRLLPGAGRRVPVTTEIRQTCAAIQAAINRYSFLYEDLFAGYICSLQEVFVLNESGDRIPVDRWRFDERAPDSHHLVQPRGKMRALLGIVEERAGKRGVVMVRFVRLAERIAAELTNAGVPVQLLHGGQRSVERAAALDAFRCQPDCVLVMTRDTGKRGLDLPEADYSVLYSPKTSEPSVWQELNRIRSTVTFTKDSFVLVYGKCGEVERAKTLAELMRGSGRAYEVGWTERAV